MHALLSPSKARHGGKVAVLSPSLAAPGFAPAVHEQAMIRLEEVTGMVPVEFPTTRELGASPADRARDICAAFADPSIEAIISTIGGDDQITVIPHLDADLIKTNPKPFLGYSDNSHLHNFLWALGIKSFYGGATQVHLGPGPFVDEIHAQSLRAALLDGGSLELTEPGQSEDYGIDWLDPRALSEFGSRSTTEPWVWSGPKHTVSGPTWGGCVEVLADILAANRFDATSAQMDGFILLLELSEEVEPVLLLMRQLRAMGERGLLAAALGVVFARPPMSTLGGEVPSTHLAAEMRRERYDIVAEMIQRYNPEAVVCMGLPFGHTRPQWIVPHGGMMTLDGIEQRVFADYS